LNAWPVSNVGDFAYIKREAGGSFTDLAGRPDPHGGSAVATNGLLQEATLTRLNST
jgi:histidinol-phosphatase